MRYFDAFRFDEVHGLLWRDNLRVPLTAKACAVLACLIESGATPLTKEDILRTVWRDTHVTPENVKVLVREIRHALGDQVHRPRYIRTVPQAGYAFIAAVHRQPVIHGTRRVFVGRRHELAQLTAQLPLAPDQGRSVSLVVGTAGIGKSSLLGQVVELAAEKGCLIARAQCLPTTLPVEPYSPLLDMFDRLIADVPRVADVIAPHAPALLQHLRVSPPLRADSETVRTLTTPRLLREIVAALEALAQDTPLVLALEDVQWLDSADVDVISALARRQNMARLAVIATTRPLEASPASQTLRQLVAELEVARVCTIVPLGMLGADDVERYLARRFSPSVAAVIAGGVRDTTSGHPLLLQTAADALVHHRALRRRGQHWMVSGTEATIREVAGDAVRGILEWQVAQLTPDERDIIVSVASAGSIFSAREAAQLLDRDQAAVTALLESLARRGEIITYADTITLAHPTPGFRFTNVLYREVVKSAATIDPLQAVAAAAAVTVPY